MKKFALLITMMVSLFAVFSISAQGNGNNPNNNDDDTQQRNAYQNGGIGFANAGNGQRWDNQQRGQMGRGVNQQGVGMYTALPPAFDGDLPEEIVDLMLAGWLDEQNAYAIYEVVLDAFGEVRPFINIQNAEAQHIAAWEFLFDRYDIETPDIPDLEGVAFASIADACTTAANAEIANFGLYDEMLEAFEAYPDIYMVTLSLRNASEFNHLPAFENCAN